MAGHDVAVRVGAGLERVGDDLQHRQAVVADIVQRRAAGAGSTMPVPSRSCLNTSARIRDMDVLHQRPEQPDRRGRVLVDKGGVADVEVDPDLAPMASAVSFMSCAEGRKVKGTFSSSIRRRCLWRASTSSFIPSTNQSASTVRRVDERATARGSPPQRDTPLGGKVDRLAVAVERVARISRSTPFGLLSSSG